MRADLIADWLVPAAVRTWDKLTLWTSNQVGQKTQYAEDQHNDEPGACTGSAVVGILDDPYQYRYVDKQHSATTDKVANAGDCGPFIILCKGNAVDCQKDSNSNTEQANSFFCLDWGFVE